MPRFTEGALLPEPGFDLRMHFGGQLTSCEMIIGKRSYEAARKCKVNICRTKPSCIDEAFDNKLYALVMVGRLIF